MWRVEGGLREGWGSVRWGELGDKADLGGRTGRGGLKWLPHIYVGEPCSRTHTFPLLVLGAGVPLTCHCA